MTESEMVDFAIECLVNKGMVTKIAKEVPFLSRCIDLVFIEPDDGTLVTVEFKLDNWKHAVRQAKDHALGADQAYICLPSRKVDSEIQRYVKKSGVGLAIYYSKLGIRFLIKPQRSRQVKAFRSLLLRQFKRVTEAGK